MAEVAFWPQFLDELFKGHLLVGIRLQGDFSYLVE